MKFTRTILDQLIRHNISIDEAEGMIDNYYLNKMDGGNNECDTK